MEAVISVAIWLVIGAVLGGAAGWFAARARTARDVSALRSEAALAEERQAASENAVVKIQEETDDWRRQADEQRDEVARVKEQEAALRAEIDNAQERIIESQTAHSQTREEADNWQNQASERKAEVSRLQERVAALEIGKSESDQTGAELRSEIETLRDKSANDERQSARLQAELKAANRQLAERTDIEKTMLDQFKVMASEVVSNSSESFMSEANEKVGGIVKPLAAELKRIETARNEAQGGLTEQISALLRNNESLREGTRKLTQALTRPQARGRWGEIQLRRVAELAGMIDYCDFQEQVAVPGENGRSDRPDMVVYMPSERTIVVDAKTPLNAYMESMEAGSDAERDKALRKHADQVKERARSLTQKAYWRKLEQSPEFVVMFLPGEFFLQPALERDPDLFDRAMREGVVIATPNTLIALLKTVEMGWREKKLAQEARAIADLGSEVYDRLTVYAGHISNVGRSLETTVNHYNNAVGSFDSRLSVSARKLKELGVSTDKDALEMKRIDEPVRGSGVNGRRSRKARRNKN